MLTGRNTLSLIFEKEYLVFPSLSIWRISYEILTLVDIWAGVLSFIGWRFVEEVGLLGIFDLRSQILTSFGLHSSIADLSIPFTIWSINRGSKSIRKLGIWAFLDNCYEFNVKLVWIKFSFFDCHDRASCSGVEHLHLDLPLGILLLPCSHVRRDQTTSGVRPISTSTQTKSWKVIPYLHRIFVPSESRDIGGVLPQLRFLRLLSPPLLR